jgi:nucleoside-diphosphate-sugar epimerase
VPLDIFAPRGSVLQFLFVEDAVDAFVMVIEKGHLSGVYNLACQEHIRLDQLAEMIKAMCRSNSEIHFADESVPVFSQVLCAEAQNVLGWKAKTSVREILESYG